MKNTPKINLHLPRSLSPARLKLRSKSPSPAKDSGADPGKLAATCSAGSATGNPRNKCALQPGHSLMDWIRLGNSGKDLTGVGGRLRGISPRELAAHNQPGNAWIAIRGRVYNISEYLDYHPGGPEELMRGAGKDATQLFDQVHSWVNYESLLSKCLIGPLKQTQISDEEFEQLFSSPKNSPQTSIKQKTTEVFRKSMESLKSSDINQPEFRIPKIMNSDSENKSSSDSSLNIESKCNDRISQSSESAKLTNVSISINEDEPKKSEDIYFSKFKYPTLLLTKADSIKSGSLETSADENSAELKRALPKFDWIQKTDNISLIFYTKALCNPQCNISLASDSKSNISVTINYDYYTYCFEIILEDFIIWPCSVVMNQETGKIECHLQKQVPKIWKSFGVMNKTNIQEQSVMVLEEYVECIVIDKWNINHNTSIILLKSTKDDYITFPIGYHCRVIYGPDDSLSRSYTPVPPFLNIESKPEKWTSDLICLMIKKYEQGAVSTWLTALENNNEITITKPLGSFSLKLLQDVSQFYLIAAGTGLTPMLSVIQFALQRRNPRCKNVDLLFFNRSEKDILWHDQLSALSSRDERFKLTNILSEPSSTWSGQRGHINQATIISHYSQIFSKEFSDANASEKNNFEHIFSVYQKELLICICGPTPFTQLTRTLFSGLGCSDDQIHCFLG